jgi:pimeloyl-ACP methyl ester carboxylesterase
VAAARLDSLAPALSGDGMHGIGGTAARRLLAATAALGVVGWLGSSAFVAWSLTDRPRARHDERQPRWLEAESVRLATRDGEDLGAWFHPGEPGKPLVVLLHGMGGSRASMAVAAQRLAEAGNGFLALSLRAFGDSSGEGLDFGWSAKNDVLAAVEFAEQAQPGAPLVVIGQSLGAAAAIFAAPELGWRVAGYVLEAPYRDLDKACRDRLDRDLPAPLAALAFQGLSLWAPHFLAVDPDQIRPVDHVARFPAELPVLFVAGAADVEAPVADVRLLAERCSGAAELAVLDARDHHDLWALDERHFELWSDFLARVERRSHGSGGAH